MFHFNCENEDFDALATRGRPDRRALRRRARPDGVGQPRWRHLLHDARLSRSSASARCCATSPTASACRSTSSRARRRSPARAELVTTVLDVVHNEVDVAVVDASIEAHMLDHLIYGTHPRVDAPAAGHHRSRSPGARAWPATCSASTASTPPLERRRRGPLRRRRRLHDGQDHVVQRAADAVDRRPPPGRHRRGRARVRVRRFQAQPVVSERRSDMMKKNVLIIGAGGVAHVAAHKAAMHNDVLGDICIASRTLSKCEAIIDSVQRKGHLQGRVAAGCTPASSTPSTSPPPSALIRETGSRDRRQPRLGVRQHGGARRLPRDRRGLHRHRDPRGPRQGLRGPAVVRQLRVEEGRAAAPSKGVTAILGAGFDPGVVNAYAALAAKKYFDTIDTIDILDVNAGSHGRYFATNFDPEINFREFVKVWTWIDREWQEFPTHTVKRDVRLPGRRRAAGLPQRPRRAALAVQAHRRQQHPVLDGLRRPLHQRVHRAAHARPAVARAGRSSPVAARSSRCRSSRPCCPTRRASPPATPARRASATSSRARRTASRARCSSTRCPITPRRTPRWSRRAISYTAGVPPIAAAMLIADGRWDAETNGERRGARPRAVHRAPRPRSACRPSTSRSNPTRRRRSTARCAAWTRRSPTPRRRSRCPPPTR